MSAADKALRVLQNRKEETIRDISEALDNCMQQLTGAPVRIVGAFLSCGGGLLSLDLQAMMRLDCPVLEICPGLTLVSRMGTSRAELKLNGTVGYASDGRRIFTKQFKVLGMEPSDANRFARPLLEAAGLIGDDDYMRLIARIEKAGGKPGMRDFDAFHQGGRRRLAGECPTCSYAESGGRWFVHYEPCDCSKKEAPHASIHKG